MIVSGGSIDASLFRSIRHRQTALPANQCGLTSGSLSFLSRDGRFRRVFASEADQR